jgi:hypothetical protein
MTNQVQLHVGYVGITREGKRVEIIKHSPLYTPYPWESDLEAYTGEGLYINHTTSQIDIVGPWVETPVEPLVDYKSHSDAKYNDGKWHRWAGGDRPVHPDTLVYATYIDQDDGVITDSRYARNYHWDSGHGPIVAFRVIKEYVEPPKVPREFWLIQGKIYSYYHTNTDAIHVREVLTDD